jgi:cell division septation protein DedD
MDKKGHFQLELFSPAKSAAGLMPQSGHSFLGFIWNYEKAILIIVGFIITATVSFALGVEKGKNIAAGKSQSRAFMASGLDSIRQAPAPPPVQANPEPGLKLPPALIEEEVISVPAVLAKDSAGSYTIQVASFMKKASAQKEIDTLQKKGLVVSILSKGKYLIVCVGNFMEKDEAKNLLSKLKKRYQDCFIRRL